MSEVSPLLVLCIIVPNGVVSLSLESPRGDSSSAEW